LGGGETLALKLVLTPLLVGGASLAARRWGSEVGGWLVGIPFTSAPITFFLAIGPGPHFAAQTAVGILAGTISQAAVALAYGWSAKRWRWSVCLATATIAFIAITVVLLVLTATSVATFAIAVVVLVGSLALLPRRSRMQSQPVPLPAWDLPARMIVATALVVGLTEAAPLLGPRLAGLLAPFPLYAIVLAVFAHRLQGAEPAISVLRGLLLGLFGFAGFFLTIALYLEAEGIAFAFGAAIVVALALQALSLFAGRRLAIA
jgi:hypothetical protein